MPDDQLSQEADVHVTAEERSHPAFRQLARASISIAKLELRHKNVVRMLKEIEPSITHGELHGWPAYSLGNEPFIAFYRQELACRLDEKSRRIVLRLPGSKRWQIDREVFDEWVVLADMISESDWMRWAVVAMKTLKSTNKG